MRCVTTTLALIALVAYSPSTRAASIDCSLFAYQEDAQDMLDSVGFNEVTQLLDEDADGVACEDLVRRESRFHEGDGLPEGAVEAKVERGTEIGEETIEVRIADDGGSGALASVRLIGINIPSRGSASEPEECFGKTATAKSWSIVSFHDAIVWLEPGEVDRDEDGRLLRYVWFEGKEDKGPYLANELLVREGYASVDASASDDRYADRLAEAQAQAQADGLGLWDACDESGETVEAAQSGETTFSGSTDTVTDPFPVTAGVLFLTASYSGDGNFAVWVYHANGDRDLAFNDLGPYEGEVAIPVQEAGTVFLAIETTGPWEISATQKRD